MLFSISSPEGSANICITEDTEVQQIHTINKKGGGGGEKKKLCETF